MEQFFACRNETKTKAAKEDLVKVTGKDIFDVAIMDVSDLDSVRKAVDQIKEPLDGLVLNAGPGPSKDEVTQAGRDCYRRGQYPGTCTSRRFAFAAKEAHGIRRFFLQEAKYLEEHPPLA